MAEGFSQMPHALYIDVTDSDTLFEESIPDGLWMILADPVSYPAFYEHPGIFFQFFFQSGLLQ